MVLTREIVSEMTYNVSSGTLNSTIPYRYFENELNDFKANWHQWSTGQGHETFIFGAQEVKGQGHKMPELDVEG